MLHRHRKFLALATVLAAVAPPPPTATAKEVVAGAAPEQSLPGRRLAELERVARTGDRKSARDWVDALWQCVDVVFGGRRSPPARFQSHLDWSEADAIAARRQLQAALAAGRPELLRDIGRVLERSRYGTPELFGPYAGGGASVLFALLACDLGMPCGADSEPVRASCALNGLCGYPDYESLLFDARLGERAAPVVRQHRALLLQRIRSGDVAGLFDPVPLPPPPG